MLVKYVTHVKELLLLLSCHYGKKLQQGWWKYEKFVIKKVIFCFNEAQSTFVSHMIQ